MLENVEFIKKKKESLANGVSLYVLSQNFLFSALVVTGDGSVLLAGRRVLGDPDLVRVVQLRQHDPGGEDADEKDSKVEADADEVVRVSFRLHSVQSF